MEHSVPPHQTGAYTGWFYIKINYLLSLAVDTKAVGPVDSWFLCFFSS